MAAPLVGFLARLAAKRGHALMTRKKYAKISKDYKPKSKSTDLLMKRYEIWRDLYSSNKRIAANLLQL